MFILGVLFWLAIGVEWLDDCGDIGSEISKSDEHDWPPSVGWLIGCCGLHGYDKFSSVTAGTVAFEENTRIFDEFPLSSNVIFEWLGDCPLEIEGRIIKSEEFTLDTKIIFSSLTDY